MWDDEDIGAEFFRLDAEYDVLQEIKQHKNALRDNDDEDNVDVEESEASCDAEFQMKRGIQIQKEVDKDIVSGNNIEYNHNNNDDNNKIRNRIESQTQGILLVQMEKDSMVVTPKK